MRWVLFLLIGAATLASFWAPDAKNFQQPYFARIIFFHLPCALAGTAFFFGGAWQSIKYLVKRDPESEIRAVSAIEVGTVLAVLTMITGILFSKMQWGSWWHWDPRQTSYLFVLLIYGGYFALRASFSDDAMRAKVAAAYAAFSLLPGLFLIFVYPYLPQVKKMSLHPTNVAVGGLDPTYRSITYGTLVLLLILTWWIYRLAVRAGLLELKAQNLYGNDQTRGGDPAPTGVVRPVSLPEEG